MKYTLIIILIFLQGCAYYKINGYPIYNETPHSDEDVASAISYSMARIGHREFFVGWHYRFLNDYPEKVYLKDGTVAVSLGLSDFNFKIISIKINKCIWDSALLHEMAHVVQFRMEGVYDQRHKGQYWKNVETMEAETRIRCGMGYKQQF